MILPALLADFSFRHFISPLIFDISSSRFFVFAARLCRHAALIAEFSLRAVFAADYFRCDISFSPFSLIFFISFRLPHYHFRH
jgi:hypothetical protein